MSARPTTIDLPSVAMLGRPLLTHEQHVALAVRIEHAERRVLEALLAAPAGRRALAEMGEELRAGTTHGRRLLRSVEAGGDVASDQLARLERALEHADDPSPRAMRALIDELSDLRVHPRVLERLEAAVRSSDHPQGPRSLRRVRRARRVIDAAKTQLVEGNLRLVVSVAAKYQDRGLLLQDLVQEGNVGLMQAIDRFDHRRGYRLSTYAVWWIRHHIQRALANDAPTIRLPVHLVDAKARLVRTRRRLSRDGVEPTAQELAKATGLALHKVELIRSLAPEPVSLDAPLGRETDTRFGDVIVDPTSPLPEEEVAAIRTRERAHSLLVSLTERERLVIVRRFGLDGAPECTLEEIGVTLSLTRERVRQIETVALRKLRAHCARRSVASHADV